jgi:hypothetical protein
MILATDLIEMTNFEPFYFELFLIIQLGKLRKISKLAIIIFVYLIVFKDSSI